MPAYHHGRHFGHIRAYRENLQLFGPSKEGKHKRRRERKLGREVGNEDSDPNQILFSIYINLKDGIENMIIKTAAVANRGESWGATSPWQGQDNELNTTR